MRKTIVNAPIQNKDFNPTEQVGKLTTIFVADWLREHDGHTGGHVDLWNNVVISLQQGHTEDSYKMHTEQLLDEKYDSPLLSRWRQPDSVDRVTDSEADSFVPWAQSVLEKSLDNGDVRVEDIRVLCCTDCGAPRALEGYGCSKPCACGADITFTDVRRMLMTEVDERARSLTDSASNINMKDTTPDGKTVVSKRRLGGIGLENFGIKDLKLDPRIGLGLLAVYVAHEVDADAAEMVVSRATARQNLSLLHAATKTQIGADIPSLSIRPIAKIPANFIMHLYEQDVLRDADLRRLLFEVLPPKVLSMKSDMTPATLHQIAFSKKLLK